MSKSFNTVAVIATFLLCYTCANPVTDILKGTSPKAENATTLNAEINGTTPEINNKTIVTTTIASNKTNENVTDVTNSQLHGIVPPENHTVTTPKPTTLAPETTTANLTTTVSPPTTQNPNITTTIKPAPITNATTVSPPTTIPSTSIKPATSTEPSKPTVAPTAAPHGGSDRKFDGPSFFGGIILACGLTAIGFIAFKFYKE